MKKKTEEYKNRYGDVFLFTHQPETNTILWEGNFEYTRYGWESDVTLYENRYTMVDPSGGPYVSSGMASHLVMRDVKGFVVDHLSINKDEEDKLVSVNIHLKPKDK